MSTGYAYPHVLSKASKFAIKIEKVSPNLGRLSLESFVDRVIEGSAYTYRFLDRQAVASWIDPGG
jgi:hypothetical protein